MHTTHLEELHQLGVTKVPVLDQLLAALVALRHCKAAQDGTNVFDLRMYPAGLGLPAKNVNLVAKAIDGVLR